MRPIDPDFAAYVRARQHVLLRAAYLVCGDAHRAEDLLQQAFEKLALRWDTIRLSSWCAKDIRQSSSSRPLLPADDPARGGERGNQKSASF